MNHATNGRKRPIGITLLSLLSYLTAMASIVSVGLPFPIMGTTVEGTYSSFMSVILSIISFALGYGLWNLKIYAWWLAIALNIFSLVSISLHYFRIYLAKAMYSSTAVLVGVFLYLFLIIVTFYLLKQKRWFEKRGIL